MFIPWRSLFQVTGQPGLDQYARLPTNRSPVEVTGGVDTVFSFSGKMYMVKVDLEVRQDKDNPTTFLEKFSSFESE